MLPRLLIGQIFLKGFQRQVVRHKDLALLGVIQSRLDHRVTPVCPDADHLEIDHVNCLLDWKDHHARLRIGDTHVVPEICPINQGVKRGLAPNDVRKGKPRMHDLGLYGVETCRGVGGARLLSTY